MSYYSSSSDLGDAMGAFAASGISIVLVLFFMLFSVVLTVGLLIALQFPYYRMAKNAGIPNAWLAFIPIGVVWIQFMLAKKPFDMFGGKIVLERKKAATYAIFGIVGFSIVSMVLSLLSAIPLVGILFSLLSMLLSLAYTAALMIMNFFVYQDIVDTYMPNDPNQILWVVFALVIPIVFTVILYMHMNDTPNYQYEEYYQKVAQRGR